MRVEKSPRPARLAIIIILLIALYYFGWLGWLAGLSEWLLAPVNGRAWSLVARRLPDLAAQTLATQLSVVTGDRLRLETLAQQNRELTAALDLANAHERPTVAARVIGREQTDPYVYLLDRGRIHGLLPNMPVVDQSGFFWGLIKDVKDSVSSVITVTDPRLQVSAKIIGPYDQPIALQGDHYLAGRLVYVPLESRLAVGQLIVTAGLEPLIPAALPIGQVTAIDASSEALFIIASVQPNATLREPLIVTIIKPLTAP